MPRFLSWLLLCCTILAACQAPAPISAPMTPQFTVPSGAWQLWPAAPNPQEVNVLVRDQGVLWIGTAFGVVQFDLKTRSVMRFDPIGRMENLLPTGQGQAFAATQHELFFFDGASWTKVSLSTTPPFDPSFVGGMGLDLKGDLWVWVTSGRNSLSYHFPGHVPPSAASWHNIEENAPHGPERADPCQEWRALSTYHFTFSSPEDCQGIRPAEAILKQRENYGPFAVDQADIIYATSYAAGSDTLQKLAASGTLEWEKPLDKISHLVADPQQGVWVGTFAGLFFADDNRLEHISLGLEKLTLAAPDKITIDAQGQVWVSTLYSVQYLSSALDRWESVTSDARQGGFSDLSAAHDGSVWITDRSALWHFDGQLLKQEVVFQDDAGATELEIDPAGQVWFTRDWFKSGNVHAVGLIQYDPVHARSLPHFVDQPMSHLSISKDGTIYALSSDGQLWVRRITTLDWQRLTQVNPDKMYSARLAATPHGVWFSSASTDEIEFYPIDATPATRYRRTPGDNFAILNDQQDRLWLASPGKLQVLEGATWREMTMPDVTGVKDLALAPDGRVWIVGWTAIAVYDPKMDK